MKKTTRRILSFALCLLLVLPVLALTAQPAAQAVDSPDQWKKDYLDQLAIALVRDGTYNGCDIPNYQQLNYRPTSTNVSVAELKKQYPELCNLDFYTISTDGSGLAREIRLTWISNSYIYPEGKTFQDVEAVYDAMVADLPEDLDDVTKIVALNNRLCQWTTYDHDAADEIENGIPGSYSATTRYSTTIVGPALRQKAVCSGFAKAFKYLCDKVGIPCTYQSVRYRESGYNHAANIVTIDGKDYIVDTTHNEGRDFCLLCSADKYNDHCCSSTFHSSADIQMPTAVNEEYDRAWWTDYSPDSLFYCNGAFYAYKLEGVNNKVPHKVLLRNGVQIAAFDDRWPNYTSDVIWRIADACMLGGCTGTAFYYNTADAIMKYNTLTGQATEFFRPQNADGKTLVAFQYDGATLRYLLADNATANSSEEAYAAYCANESNWATVALLDRDAHIAVSFEEGNCQSAKTVGEKCVRCGTILTPAMPTGEMGDHQVDWTETTATCTEAGTESGVCTTCWQTVTREAPAKGHNFSLLAAVNAPTEDNHYIAPSCETAGTTMTLHCADCDAVQAAKTIPASAHAGKYFYNDGNTKNYVTCTSGGTVPGIRCTKCLNVLREPAAYPDGFGHDPEEISPYVVPTCEKSGKEARIVCKRCRYILQSGNYINPLHHNYVEVSPVIEHPATCTADRYTVSTACERCGKEGNKMTYTNTRGHVDANDDKICDDCGTAITADTKMRGWNHNPGDNGGDNGGNNGGRNEEQPKLNFFQRIIEWFRNLFAKLFGR